MKIRHMEENGKEQKERSGKRAVSVEQNGMNSGVLSRRGPREGSFNTQVEWPAGPQDIGNSISPIAARYGTRPRKNGDRACRRKRGRSKLAIVTDPRSHPHDGTLA